MNITILAVGKIKETYLKDGILEYLKRISAYCNIEIMEVPDEKAPEKLSIKQQNQIKDLEGERLLSKISKDAYVIALDLKGKQLTSENLANKIQDIQTYHSSHIIFVIGGSLGLSNSVLTSSNFRLSFSHLTFPHQMMRLVLLEQIYRSFRINNNEPYHK